MTRVLVAAAVALGAALWFLVLTLHHPNLDYGSVETECTPVLGFGDEDLRLTPGGNPFDVDVVRGADVVSDLQLELTDGEDVDESFVRRQLAADCANRRTTLLGWSFLPAALFTLGAVGCAPALMSALRGVRGWGPRSPENWRDLP